MMEVLYTKEDYNQMQKEVCFLANDLRQLLDTVCSDSFWDNFELQANATFSASMLCDRIKNFLVQMNFITVNVVNGQMGKENKYAFDLDGNNNSSSVDSIVGDNMELHTTSEGDIEVLEDGKTGNVEIGNQEYSE